MRRSNVSAMRAALNDVTVLHKIGFGARMKMMRVAAETSHTNIDCSINDRARIADSIKQNSINGKVHVEVWQRDCDCAEWTTKIEIEASVYAYLKRYYEVVADAEGPVRFTILTPFEAASWKRESRDRALEAFENGSYYSV